MACLLHSNAPRRAGLAESILLSLLQLLQLLQLPHRPAPTTPVSLALSLLWLRRGVWLRLPHSHCRCAAVSLSLSLVQQLQLLATRRSVLSPSLCLSHLAVPLSQQVTGRKGKGATTDKLPAASSAQTAVCSAGSYSVASRPTPPQRARMTPGLSSTYMHAAWAAPAADTHHTRTCNQKEMLDVRHNRKKKLAAVK